MSADLADFQPSRPAGEGAILLRRGIQHLPPMEFEAILQGDDENKESGWASCKGAICVPVDGMLANDDDPEKFRLGRA